MPTVLETNTATLRTVASHQISFKGIAGVIFWSILCGLLVLILALATEGWVYIQIPSHYINLNNDIMRTLKVGLFQTCICSEEMEAFFQKEVWFIVIKILFVVAIICVFICMIVTILYMFIHSPRVSKDKTLFVSIITAFLAVILSVLGLFTMGIKTSQYASSHAYGIHNTYSFAFAAIAGFFILLSGLASVIQCIRARHRARAL